VVCCYRLEEEGRGIPGLIAAYYWADEVTGGVTVEARQLEISVDGFFKNNVVLF